MDGAMTNCVFAKGYVAFTAELSVRFQHPVTTGVPATIRAWIDKSYRPLHYLKAELLQDQVTKVTAEGKFMERPEE
jgi:acyl-coenzyme A thioesterase PaaI-like protein